MANGEVTCTVDELKSAFISFSNTIDQLGLKFYKPEFGAPLTGWFNPIVILGRWETTLNNRHLKPCDRLDQWKVLLELPLVRSAEAIRAITDHENDANPCGFIIPQMLLTERFFAADKWSFQSTMDYKQITDERCFWRYISYQPQRNSLAFYQAAINHIERIGFQPDSMSKANFYQTLAGSTTKSNHLATNTEAEATELVVWAKLCTKIKNIETATLTLRALCKIAPPGDLKNIFAQSFRDLRATPPLLFLGDIGKKMIFALEDLGPTTFAVALATQSIPATFQLLDNISRLINRQGLNYYHGAKFYFNNPNGKWIKPHDIKTYTALQLHVDDIRHVEKQALLTPLLSTFNIKTNGDIDALASFTILLTRKDLLTYCFTLFNDIQQNRGLNKDVLLSLINHINTHPWGEQPLIELVDYLEQQFGTHFALNYFKDKKRQLTDAAFGLTEAQIKRVRDCLFLPEQQQAIINIESTLIQKNPRLTDDDLNAMNEHFMNLKNVITPGDFTGFTERLASIKDHLATDPRILNRLLTCLTQKRSLEDFTQFYMRNQIEQCLDEHVLQKAIFFIEQVKPLSALDGLAMDRLTLQETLCTLVLNAHHDAMNADYVAVLRGLIVNINTIATTHPHVLYYLMDSFNHLPHKQTERYLPSLMQFGVAIDELSTLLPAGDDDVSKDNMLTFYSLLAIYHQKPAELTALAKTIRPLTDAAQQRFILTFVSRLLDNDQSLEGLAELIEQFVKTPALFERFANTCQTPPYPNIKTLSVWLTSDNFAELYSAFTQKPYGPRHPEYAFNGKKYTRQADKFIGLNPSTLFTPTLGMSINADLIHNRDASLSSLREHFNDLRARAEHNPFNPDDMRELLCVCIEILARTTSQRDLANPSELISQELNSTQVMALYALLTNPSRQLISEIDTGEGKSRIMMIYAACQAALGKTVDLLTSDMQLAERDYLSYNPFFTTLGVRTSLISLSTPPELYQKGGINFSDNSQLLLLRNKTDITRRPHDYLDERAERRCLLIDEVDKFTHDKSKDAYNFAANSKKLSGFVWIYPLLVDFMQTTIKESSKLKLNPESQLDAFTTYLHNHHTNIMDLAAFADLKENRPEQIKTWLRSAFTALHMNSDVHYKMTEADESMRYTVRDTEGHTRHTRKIFVLDNGRPMEGSSFSDGVQQCLCAKENLRLNQEQFVILPENETQRSSYPVSFMAAYENGSVFGVSGTTRSAAPRANEAINHEQYEYILVPREKALLREDKHTWIAKDQKQQIKFIKQAITQALKQGNPILLICKDDNQSLQLHDALNMDTKFMALVKNLQRVHGLTPSAHEKKAIDKAGEPCALTISTAGMFGRGVDINATNLLVLAAYVPTLEDDKQIKGRTARAGKKGMYRMIPNINDSENRLNGKTYNVSNEVHKVQNKKALDAVYREEVSKLYALFLEDITERFLKGYNACEPLKRGEQLEQWKVFLSLMQKDWDGHAHQLLQWVESKKQTEFIALFNTFKDKWTAKAPVVADVDDSAQRLNTKKMTDVYNGLIQQNHFFSPKRAPLKVQRRYDPADDGQARVYSTLFAREMATLRGERRVFADFHAWREGRGNLFPDLMAVLKGERNLFANLIATIKRLINEFNDWRHRPKTPKPDPKTTQAKDKDPDVGFKVPVAS